MRSNQNQKRLFPTGVTTIQFPVKKRSLAEAQIEKALEKASQNDEITSNLVMSPDEISSELVTTVNLGNTMDMRSENGTTLYPDRADPR